MSSRQTPWDDTSPILKYEAMSSLDHQSLPTPECTDKIRAQDEAFSDDNEDDFDGG